MNPFEVRLRTERGREWRTFRDPTAVLRATRAAEVAGCLAEVDRAVRQDGCYAAGFVTYEAAAAFGLPAHERAPDGLPLVCFGLFKPESVSAERDLPAAGVYEAGPWHPSIDRAAYDWAIRRIDTHVEVGDAHQVTFTVRLSARFAGDPLALVRTLDAVQDGPYGAYVDDGRHAICSASSELLFSWNGDRIECRPVKGTAPRGLWAAMDRLQADRLGQSEKARAQNVRVVDMLQNDLGRIAQAGAVEAASLFALEPHPLEWQMTSTVTARAREAGLLQMFEALFPSGAATGAPRLSSMRIIHELETGPRGMYTGAIGYLSPHGRGHFTVATRTITVDRRQGSAELGVANGISSDPVERAEYSECLRAPAILLERTPRSYAAGPHPDFQLLETILWTPADGFALLSRHLNRLQDSAACFGFECDAAEVKTVLDATVEDLAGPSTVRVLVSRDGAIVCEGIDLTPLPERPLQVVLAAEPVDAEDVFLYHKTTRRRVHDRARRSRRDADAVLLWNANGEVTEATEANVVAEIDGHKVTPPIECGLLPGTLRAELLADGAIRERRIAVADLHRATGLWVINSVRGWLPAKVRP
jgi:para-aminobenzoate synthetase/4-amino-4-deoxychorismate lyase